MGNTVRQLPCKERKGGKIRPVGTISREVMRCLLVEEVFASGAAEQAITEHGLLTILLGGSRVAMWGSS